MFVLLINKTVMTKETLQQIPYRSYQLRSQQEQSKENPAINVNA
jgi:hypothetical protein